MQYDIAAKVLMEKCREEILRRFLGLSVTESSILEPAPQETVSVKRSDFPILVTDESGKQQLVLLEIQSEWEIKFPIRLLDYRCRHMLKHDVEATKLPHLLVSKRRDIMIESAAYDIIKEEGLKEGREEGLRKGREEGLREGLERGLQEGILEILEIRFNVGPESIVKSVRNIENTDILRILRRNSLKVSNLEEMKILLKQIKE